MKYTIKNLAIIILAAFSLSACIHENFEKPEIKPIPVGDMLTLTQVRQIYTDSVASGIYPQGYKFTKDYTVLCTCTMDDKSGNIYKTAYVQDEDGAAMNLHLLSAGGIYQGDKIHLHLKGLILDDYEKMLQLDSVHVDNNITKLSTQIEVEPKLLTISQVQSGQYQGQLVRIEDVEFEENALGSTWADAINLQTTNHMIQDCNGLQLIVRTSGYASFASEKVPTGKGSIVGIVGQFKDDFQFTVRSLNEVNMTGYRCGTAVVEQNFDAVENNQVLNLDNWKNIAVNGSVLWFGQNTSTLTAAKFTPSNTDANQETWLISPEIQVPDGESTSLSFRTNGGNDLGGELTVWISTDYNGSNDPSTATWTQINATIVDPPASGLGTWTDSGLQSLEAYTESYHIAFKYVGTNSEKTLYYLDDFLVSLN